MIDLNEFFKNSLFTYYITNVNVSDISIPEKVNVKGWKIYASEKTEVRCFDANNGISVAVLGYCIDSRLEIEREDIPSYLSSFDDETFSDALSRFAGKFVVAKFDAKGVRIYTDATASLPVFYANKDGHTHIASLEYFIKENTGCPVSEKALHIIKKSDEAKTFPGEISHYENVYALLPGHYYSSELNKQSRYGKKGRIQMISAKEAAEKTAYLICNIANQIASDYEIKCPLTGGYDSRVVLAALEKNSYGDPGIYTMRHNMPESNSDIAIPKMIAKDKGYKHTLIDDKKASLEEKSMCDRVMGKGLYSSRTLDIVITLKEHIGSACLLNGDIMGQIGKSSLHRSIKECFMGPRYYQCKVHNTSKHSLREIKKWYKSAKDYGITNICDKFSKEIRLGRWAADENSLYSLYGINVINIFNSSDIIGIWECVPRKERKNSLLHKELIRLMDSKLMYYSFGAEKLSLTEVLRKSDLGFYAATFIKFYLQITRNCLNFK